jgi:hypothetical protein
MSKKHHPWCSAPEKPRDSCAQCDELDERFPEEKPKKVVAYHRWGGFDSNGLHSLEADTGWGGMGEMDTELPAIFRTEKEARERYHDVRRVTILFEE